jgi:hypothetical protein
MVDWDKWKPTKFTPIEEAGMPSHRVIQLNDGVKAYIFVGGVIPPTPVAKQKVRDKVITSILDLRNDCDLYQEIAEDQALQIRDLEVENITQWDEMDDEIEALESKNRELSNRIEFLEHVQGKFGPGQEIYRKSTGEGPFVLVEPAMVPISDEDPSQTGGWIALKGKKRHRIPTADLKVGPVNPKGYKTFSSRLFKLTTAVVCVATIATTAIAAFSFFHS